MKNAFYIGQHRTKSNNFGQIRFADLQETFDLLLIDWTPEQYYSHWREQVEKLLDGEEKVSLMTWAATPDKDVVRRAFVLYRVEADVFCQEKIFLSEFQDEFEVLEDGSVRSLTPLQFENEEGAQISTWKVGIEALREYKLSV